MRSLVSLRAFITVLKWELMWTRAFNAPILSLSNLDLTGDGVEEIAVATTRGLQILQHDIDKVQVPNFKFNIPRVAFLMTSSPIRTSCFAC